MTISELLKSGHEGYFYVNPNGLCYQIRYGCVREGAWITKDAEVTTAISGHPDGWVLCLTIHNNRNSVYVDLHPSDEKLRSVLFQVAR